MAYGFIRACVIVALCTATVGCVAHRTTTVGASAAPKVEQIDSLVRLALNDTLENRKSLVSQWQLEMTAYSSGSSVVATVLTRPGLAIVVLADPTAQSSLGVKSSDADGVLKSVRNQLHALKSTAGSDQWQVVLTGFKPTNPNSVMSALQDSLPRRDTFVAFSAEPFNGAGSMSLTSAFGSTDEAAFGDYL